MGAQARLPGDEAFAAALRAERQRAGLTQAQLAERAGVPVGTLAKAEQGERQVSVGLAASLAQALGLPLDQMVTHPEPVTKARPGRPARRDRAAGRS